MNTAINMTEHRQFGRREVVIRGRVVAPGTHAKSFTVSNLSEGGALLAFDESMRFEGTFRIELEGAAFKVLCEVRHQSVRGIGVRFLRASEGAAVHRQFLEKPLVSAATAAPVSVSRMPTVMKPIGGQELRAVLNLGPCCRSASDPAP